MKISSDGKTVKLIADSKSDSEVLLMLLKTIEKSPNGETTLLGLVSHTYKNINKKFNGECKLQFLEIEFGLL